MRLLVTLLLCLPSLLLVSQKQEQIAKFQQLGSELPTPNTYRTASGAPGPEYWQQRADYKMDIRLDDETQRIYGTETITYFNQSPNPLEYLWLQLDQNMRAKDSDTYLIGTSDVNQRMTIDQLKRLDPTFDGGFKLDYVQDAQGKDLSHFY